MHRAIYNILLPRTGWHLIPFPTPQRVYGRTQRHNQLFSDGWFTNFLTHGAPLARFSRRSSANILDFRRSLSFYLKIWLAKGRLIAILSLAGPPRDPKISSRLLKNSFSDVKLVWEVNCSRLSNISAYMCLICSRSRLKRLKDINKNAISINAMNHRKG